MNAQKSSKCSIQIGDALVEFFPNQRRLLNTTYYDRADGRLCRFCSLHTHPYAEVFVCGGDPVTIRTPDGQFRLEGGNIAIIPAGIMHTKLENPDTDDAQWVSVGIMCSECRTSGEAGIFALISSVIDSDAVSVFKTGPEIYGIMVRVVQKDPSLISLSDKIRFANQLCCLVADAEIQPTGSPDIRRITKTDIDRLVKLDALINTKYMYNISNKQLADELYLSERQLSRLVNRYYGVPLHTLINNKRVEIASALLTETDRTVEQIAYTVGFSGKTGLYREFRKLHGQTPLQYRKNRRL